MNTLYFVMGFLVGIISGFLLWVWLIQRIAKEVSKMAEPERKNK